MTDAFADLYDRYQTLASAEDPTQLHDLYVACFENTKGDDKEKKLAAQIISKYFRHFPSVQETALNALLDLCEDEQSEIRICAMKALPLLCKDSKKHIVKIADILAQLLQLEKQDYAVACGCLTQVFRQEPTTVCKAILNFVNTSNDETAREKCISYLYEKLSKISDISSSELENILIEEGKKLLRICGASEFITIIPFLKSSKYGKTISGQTELINLVAERIELDGDFECVEHETNRLIMCVDFILPLFSASIQSTKFLIYYCDQVLPQWANFDDLKDGATNKLHLLRQLAELSINCGKLENPSLHVVQIFDKLKDFMPPPPEDREIGDGQNLNFTAVECLLFAFHRLARQCPDFLTSDHNVLTDFRARLTYFSRGVQGCKKSLQTALKTNADMKEKKQAKVAPMVLDNLNSLIKDLFYTPPVYKCTVVLSFLTDEGRIGKKIVKVEEDARVKSPQKRHIPITFEGAASNGKYAKSSRNSGDNVKIYQPPSGKFSNNFQGYDNRSGSRSRGGRQGRGGGRGRGGGGNRTWRK